MIFLAKIKGYLIAFGIAALTLIGVYLKGSSDQKTKTDVRQKGIELDSYKTSVKAEKEAVKQTEMNKKKADSGDFSGFNR